MADTIKPLKQKYETEVIPELKKEFGIDNVMAVPKIEKIVINSGVGRAKEDSSILGELEKDIAAISGQKPIRTRSKQAVSNFKIREGMDIGLKVTLRQERMWYFLDKLVNIALPRTKDFRGVSPRAFDRNGNYSLGIEDQTIFPEIDTTKSVRLQGLQISIITNTFSDEQAFALLKKLGMPFKSK